MTTSSCLIEIGTEELPPLLLETLSKDFLQQVKQRLEAEGFSFEKIIPYATPRRLALMIHGLGDSTPSKVVERKGPAVKAAFDAEGNPTPPCLGFAATCGCEVSELQTVSTEKGDWLVYRKEVEGRTLKECLPTLVSEALEKMPMPKSMRWGDSSVSFIRPIHWVVLLYGDTLIPGNVLGLTVDRMTEGHPVHHPKPISLLKADDYVETLEKAYVLVDVAARKAHIASQVKALAHEHQSKVNCEEGLLQEVTALVEWPVALLGHFDASFLMVPHEALIMSMKVHQRYFHLYDEKGALQPFFITVSNLKSENPSQVVKGNERVLNARLSDAAFFYEQDLKHSLDAWLEEEKNVTFQGKLGSLYEKSLRVAALAKLIATKTGANPQEAEQAGRWCKVDLMSDMVGEFPELQGMMGRYYALAAKAPACVAEALFQHYQPRFAADDIPTNPVAQCVALADRLDTLVGILSIGLKPTGDKDPFGLRRAALGVLRILIQGRLNLDLKELLIHAAVQYTTLREEKEKQIALVSEALSFILDRLKSWYQDQGISQDVFAAVMARNPTHPWDIHQRMEAVNEFRHRPESQALAAANKRVRRLLSKEAAGMTLDSMDENLCVLEAEKQLAAILLKKQKSVEPLFQEGHYGKALAELASLKEPVDRFFEEVMVMVDDAALQRNRLALLNRLQQLFLHVADISLLQ